MTDAGDAEVHVTKAMIRAGQRAFAARLYSDVYAVGDEDYRLIYEAMERARRRAAARRQLAPSHAQTLDAALARRALKPAGKGE